MSAVAIVELAERLDESIAIQERLLELVRRQRPAIVSGRHAEVESISAAIEVEVMRLAGVERARGIAAETLADALGLAATRWSALRAALDPAGRATLQPRIGRIESLVRELELANAVNGQLVRQELGLLDMSVRSLASPGPHSANRAYTAAGSRAAAPSTAPLMLNTAA